MMLKCSHIICKVDDITTVVRDYEALGFTMQWGSAPQRAHNALLWFEHGPFIEFFQIPTSLSLLSFPLGLIYGRAAGQRFKYWSKCTEGWCDVALEPERVSSIEMLNGEHPNGEHPNAEYNRKELEDIQLAVRQLGMPTSRIINGKRTRPDGNLVRYSLFAPKETELPFIVSHYDPPQRPKKIEHPNGATGIEWVKMGLPSNLMSPFRALISGDEWLRAESAEITGVLEVGLSGLKESLDTSLLHGAVFAAARTK
ncbi:VOC family protein [Paenibacillus sp. 481]|uniref:VOC family protein n=1 Tax=Paenibacillus sp. 481 TaxID=2835869 RepID=UPI001E4F24D6|nr:VOC family protein [Paenibacillus sp. 481]UHA73196.1 VOC family protein [Paenibacillus sp. 481]